MSEPDMTLSKLALASGALHQAANWVNDATRHAQGAVDDATAAVELARAFVILRDAREAMLAHDKELGKLMNFLSNSRIPEAMESEGLRTVAFDDLGRRVQVSTRQTCSINSEKKEAALQWLRENGAEALIIETVNSQTLSSFSKYYVEENLKDLPEDLFKINSMKYVSAVKI